MAVPMSLNEQGSLPSTPKQPSEWRRVIRVFSVLPTVILLISVLSASLMPQPAPNGPLLLVFLLIASFVAWLPARDIWALRVRQLPLWLDVAGYVFALGGLAVLIGLRESKIFVWNMIYLDAFFFWCTATIACVTWITERRKGVRVYIGARRLKFVYARAGL